MPPDWKLSRGLMDVCNTKASDKPMFCENPTYGSLLRQKTSKGEAPINAVTKQKLLTVLCAAKDKAPADGKGPNVTPKIGPLTGSQTNVPGYTKIADFNAKTDAEQLAFVDEIWKRLVDFRIPNTDARKMTEHDGPVAPKETPLPTSLKPADKDATDLIPERRDGRRMWARESFGYRVEGGKGVKVDDWARIKQFGPQPLFHNASLLQSLRGWMITGTYVDKQDRIFLWWGNEDVLNESATCVSRSLFGATALPGRDTDTAAAGLDFHYLLVIKCAFLRGCDTEDWQIKRGAGAVWRPGEKAFLGAGPDCVVGWTKLVKEPAPTTKGGWRFKLPETCWTWVNQPPSSIVEKYLTDEIEAFKADHWYNVSGDFDFAK